MSNEKGARKILCVHFFFVFIRFVSVLVLHIYNLATGPVSYCIQLLRFGARAFYLIFLHDYILYVVYCYIGDWLFVVVVYAFFFSFLFRQVIVSVFVVFKSVFPHRFFFGLVLTKTVLQLTSYVFYYYYLEKTINSFFFKKKNIFIFPIQTIIKQSTTLSQQINKCDDGFFIIFFFLKTRN